MCGIVGLFASDGRPVSVERLRAMNATLIHRGPDQEGLWCADGVGLAMRRLSIIGVADGRQPLFDERGDVAVVMNGEIYNHVALRAALRARGHVFRTGSDVEVAVHLYEEQGEAFVESLRGMFAYALYDRRRGRLLLGRDRLGKKPLYWSARGGMVAFASEVKALQASGLCDAAVDGDALEAWLANGFVAGERTLYAGVDKLPAGCQLAVSVDGVTRRRYWQLPAPSAAPPAADPAAAAGRVRALLDDAVRVRLMSEVPLGAFLSGGVDSSALVALMRQHLGGGLETFAVGFGDAAFDELAPARAAAAHYETRHHELLVRGCSPALLAEIVWHHDEPAADPAIVPTFCLARFARQRVTVALTGEGGDELFGGYAHHRAAARLAALEARLSGLRGVARALLGLEPLAGERLPRKLWKGLQVVGLGPLDRPRGLVSLFTDADVRRLLGRRSGYGATAFRDLQAALNGIDPVGRSLWVDTRAQLAEQLLMKVDKATMAASLEARCPFLDQALVEYVAALPTAWKVSPRGGKWLLRQALRGLVPDAILDRRKHGFEVPIRTWLLGELRPLAGDLLLAGGARLHGRLDPTLIRARWARLEARPDQHLAKQLWALLTLAVWNEHLVGGAAARPVAAPAAPARGAA
jgi:asparagine synthase (glutamine-hydrolysing)